MGFYFDRKSTYCELNFQLRHPVFGRDKHLEEFLVHKNAPIRAKIKKGFLTGVKESLEMRKTSTIRDPDDFFQKEKEWAMAYGTQIKEVCDRFNGLSSAKMRLSNQVILRIVNTRVILIIKKSRITISYQNFSIL